MKAPFLWGFFKRKIVNFIYIYNKILQKTLNTIILTFTPVKKDHLPLSKDSMTLFGIFKISNI